jgi:hypothetical protein
VTVLVSPLAALVRSALKPCKEMSHSHVLNGSLGQMLVDVVESVLGDVSDSQSGVLVHCSLLGHSLSSQQLDQGGFTSTIGSDDTDTRREGEGTRDVFERWLGSAGVGECTSGQFHDRSGVGSNTHQRTRGREGESNGRSVSQHEWRTSALT